MLKLTILWPSAAKSECYLFPDDISYVTSRPDARSGKSVTIICLHNGAQINVAEPVSQIVSILMTDDDQVYDQ